MDYNKHSTVFLSQFINKLGINWPFYDPLFPQQSILANLFKGSSNDYVYLQSLKLLHRFWKCSFYATAGHSAIIPGVFCTRKHEECTNSEQNTSNEENHIMH